MANYIHAGLLVDGVPPYISNIASDRLCLAYDDLTAWNDFLQQEQHKLLVQLEQQKVLGLEEQKKFAASITIQRWYHRITFRRFELEQQFKIQQRLDLEEKNRIALEE